MVLLKDGNLTDDTFTDVSQMDTLPASGAILVSLTQWQEHCEELKQRSEPVGIVLRSDEKPEAIQDDLASLALIALDFPAFGDGRAYSSARVLRDQLGYAGELRAIGDVLLEQLHFMQRVGFNAFEINSNDAESDWQTAAADISVWYQDTGDGRATAVQLRQRKD